jgi:hypothetical protein
MCDHICIKIWYAYDMEKKQMVHVYIYVHIPVHVNHVSDPELGHLIQFMLLWIFWEALPQLRRLGSPFQIEWKTRIETICAMLSL